MGSRGKSYENPSKNRKMILKENIRTTRLKKGEGITPYLTRIQNVRDELVGVGEKPSYSELVRTTFNAFTKEWHTFIKVISG